MLKQKLGDEVVDLSLGPAGRVVEHPEEGTVVVLTTEEAMGRAMLNIRVLLRKGCTTNPHRLRAVTNPLRPIVIDGVTHVGVRLDA